ncbi:hypothetical protein BBJ28_00024625, partial [Nothophytophthora sp. Chile5]
QQAQASQAHLVLWFFEHCLKTAYAQLTAVLAAGMDDAVDSHKRACLRAASALLRAKPEQEAVLLGMLVNKLGDPDRKIAAYLHRMLQELLREHSAMKRVVVDEVERLLTRPKVSDRAKYNAVLFLNQLYLDADGDDADLAGHLISVYFGIFSKEVHGRGDEQEKSKKTEKKPTKHKKSKKKASSGPAAEEAMDRKLLSSLLVGVNRAFPYAKATSANFTDEIDSLFEVVHRAHHSTSVQALMLLFQVMNSTNSVSDRFYIALYAKLVDPKLRETSKHTLFLNLIFRAMKADVSPARCSAFAKRLLQLAGVMPPAFACGVLFLLSELLKLKPQLRTLLDQPETGSASAGVAEDEHFEDAKTEETPGFELEKEDEEEESGDDATLEEAGAARLNDGLTDAERSQKVLEQMFGKAEPAKTASPAAAVSFEDEPSAVSAVKKAATGQEAGGYDGTKRNPLFAGAETACAWELHMLVHHYHPSVQMFARQLLEDKTAGIQYAGDPLVDFTLHAFFEKFVNKKPRHKTVDGGSGSAKAKNWTFAAINSEAVLRESEADVDASDQFFYKFFKERASRDAALPPGSRRAKKKKTQSERDGDAFSDLEDDEDEDMEAYAQQLAEGIMEDGNLDDEDPDTAGWSGSEEDEGQEELTLDGEAEEEDSDAGDVDEEADEEEDEDEDDEDGFDFSAMGGMDDEDEVLQDELEALATKREKQQPPKAGAKRKSLFASADDYEQMVKDALAKQAEDGKRPRGRGKKSKKPRRCAVAMGRLLENLLRPGSREFVVLLNCVLALLFFVMLAVVYTELEDSYHVFVLLFLVVGLTFSINWFIIEANRLKHTQVAGDADAAKQKQNSAARAKTD